MWAPLTRVNQINRAIQSGMVLMILKVSELKDFSVSASPEDQIHLKLKPSSYTTILSMVVELSQRFMLLAMAWSFGSNSIDFILVLISTLLMSSLHLAAIPSPHTVVALYRQLQ